HRARGEIQAHGELRCGYGCQTPRGVQTPSRDRTLARQNSQALAVEEGPVVGVCHSNDVVRADLQFEEPLADGKQDPVKLLFRHCRSNQRHTDENQHPSAQQNTAKVSTHVFSWKSQRMVPHWPRAINAVVRGMPQWIGGESQSEILRSAPLRSE